MNAATHGIEKSKRMDDHSIKHKILGIDPGTNIMGYALLNTELNKSEVEILSVLQMTKMSDAYAKLKYIYERINGLIEQYHPDELAIESPFVGINPASMIKLCRAQGVAMAAAVEREGRPHMPCRAYEDKDQGPECLPGALRALLLACQLSCRLFHVGRLTPRNRGSPKCRLSPAPSPGTGPRTPPCPTP